MGQILVREEFEKLMAVEDIDDRLIVTPILDKVKQIGQGSIDLRLGTEFLEASRRGVPFIDPMTDSGTGPAGRPTNGGSRNLTNAELYASRLLRSQNETKTYVPLGQPFTLHPGQFALGATLEFLSMPRYVVGQVVSRSSWGRLGLLVATAVAVQPGFRGVLTLELVNTGSVPIVLRPGLRIAQLQLWTSDASTSAYGQDDKYPAPLGPEGQKLAWESAESVKLHTISAKMHSR